MTDVCLDVGFSSLGSFSALFARRVGASPSAYRAAFEPRPSARSAATLYPGCLNLMGAAFAILEKQDHGCPEDTGTVAAGTRGKRAQESRCASS